MSFMPTVTFALCFLFRLYLLFFTLLFCFLLVLIYSIITFIFNIFLRGDFTFSMVWDFQFLFVSKTEGRAPQFHLLKPKEHFNINIYLRPFLCARAQEYLKGDEINRDKYVAMQKSARAYPNIQGKNNNESPCIIHCPPEMISGDHGCWGSKFPSNIQWPVIRHDTPGFVSLELNLS